MTRPDGLSFGSEAPEADVVDQHIPAESADAAEPDTWQEAARLTTLRDWEASEADLIDQAIEVPLLDDESGFDR